MEEAEPPSKVLRWDGPPSLRDAVPALTLEAPLAKTPPRRDTSESDHIRAKTVVTSISKITDRPPGKEACLVVIYGNDLGKKYNLDAATLVLGRSSKCDIQIDQESVSRGAREDHQHGQVNPHPGPGLHQRHLRQRRAVLEEHAAARRRPRQGRRHASSSSWRAGTSRRCTTKRSTGSRSSTASPRCTTSATSSSTSSGRSAAATATGRALSLVMFDIDHFKKINDTFGHLAGDYVCKSSRRPIKTQSGGGPLRPLRRRGVRHRVAGDRRIQRRTSSRRRCAGSSRATDFIFEETKIPVTISMGVATLDADTADSAALIKRADERLYEAKKAGRNCVRG